MPLSSTGDNGGTTIVLGGGNSGGGTDWTDWIRTGLALKSALQKPSFTQQPMSPEMKQIWQIYINNLMNPAYKDLGPQVLARAQQQADRLTNAGGWTSPKTFSGDEGYHGTGIPFGGIGGGGAGGAGGNSWSQSSTPAEHPNTNFSGGASDPSLARKFTPNMQQWDPASGFPMSPTSPQSDPNKEISLDRAGHPLANANPSGANGSLFQSGRDIGAGWAAGQPGQGFSSTGAPSGMGYSAGDLPGFTNFLRSQGVKDATKVAIGLFSGGLAGGALAAAKVWWDHYQQQSKGGASATPPSSSGGGGFIPGSISGKGGGI